MAGAGVIVALGVGAAVSAIATPAARWLAARHGSFAIPNERTLHKHPLPTSGGVAIIIGFIAAALLTGAQHVGPPTRLLAILAGALLVAGVGLVDDRIDLPAKLKLGLQFVAALPLLFAGVRIDFISNPFHHGLIPLPEWLSCVVTVLWVVGVTNAINLIDGVDGLAAGVSAISCMALAVIALNWGQPAVALLCAALAGGALGYLPYNWNPSTILMGDTGAYFLGYIIAAITILGAFKSAAAIAILVPILVLAVPLFDTVLSPVRRYLNGKPAFKADRDHLHHRLLALGLSVPRVVLLTYAVTALCGAVAIWISRKG
jgi:UDP-GlcNAc:undecaprenyl-phosphate GlcNAc-1-phosphate transferase